MVAGQLGCTMREALVTLMRLSVDCDDILEGVAHLVLDGEVRFDETDSCAASQAFR